MAWTAPMTAVANAVFTAAQFNTHVRDNFLETSPAKATTQGSYFVTNSANSIIERFVGYADLIGTAAQSTSSTSYTNLTTTGPTVTVDTGTQALVILSSAVGNDTAGSYAAMSIDVSGATTIAAADNNALVYRTPTGSTTNQTQSANAYVLTLNAGSNVFTAKYRAITSGSATFERRRVTVIPF